jgi:site-specific DNA-cytosine methylase
MQMIEASHYKGISNQRCFAILDNGKLRYIHPVECERLQNLPDDYTKGVSNTQRYKMIGNGWTVDVIAYICSYINVKHNNLKEAV